MGVTPAIDLTTDLRRTVLALLNRYLPNTTVWAYGSRVKWTSHPASDLDLVAFAKPEQGPRIAELREAFDDSFLPFRVDLFVWDDVPRDFRTRIEAAHMVLAGKERPVCREWPTVTLGDYIEMNDAAYAPKENWPFVNYLDTGNVTDNRIGEIQHLVAGEDEIPSRARRKVQRGDIVYSTVRPNQRHFGLLKEVPENFLASTGFAVIRGKKDCAHTDFLFWFLAQNSVIEQLHTIAEHSASAYPSIRPADIERLTLGLPPLSEQRAIAGVLNALDDKIELNRRMSETLEAMAGALFKSWFVDFDPALAQMPDGWRVRSLGDLLELVYGKALRADERREGSVPVYGSNGQVGWHDRKLVAGPGIVVGRKGNPGVVTWSQGDFFPIDTTFYVVPKGKVGLRFLFYALRNQKLHSVAADSAVPGLNRNIAYMSRQLVPSDEVMDAFDGYADGLLSRQAQLDAESRKLASLRDTLLPKLLSGEICTQDAEKLAEAAT